jgi:hypothetical protein
MKTTLQFALSLLVLLLARLSLAQSRGAPPRAAVAPSMSACAALASRDDDAPYDRDAAALVARAEAEATLRASNRAQIDDAALMCLDRAAALHLSNNEVAQAEHLLNRVTAVVPGDELFRCHRAIVRLARTAQQAPRTGPPARCPIDDDLADVVSHCGALSDAGARRNGTDTRRTAATVLRGVALVCADDGLAGALAALDGQAPEIRMLRAQPRLPGGVASARLIIAAREALQTIDAHAWDPAADSIRVRLSALLDDALRAGVPADDVILGSAVVSLLRAHGQRIVARPGSVGEALRDLVRLDERRLLAGEAPRAELTDINFTGLSGARLGPSERATVRRVAEIYQRLARHDARAAVPLLWLEANALDPDLDACAEARERMGVHLRFDRSGARGTLPDASWRDAMRGNADRGRLAALHCADASAVLARETFERVLDGTGSTTPHTIDFTGGENVAANAPRRRSRHHR